MTSNEKHVQNITTLAINSWHFLTIGRSLNLVLVKGFKGFQMLFYFHIKNAQEWKKKREVNDSGGWKKNPKGLKLALHSKASLSASIQYQIGV